GRRAGRGIVRVVRGELRARTAPLPRLRRERRRVPHAPGPGPAGHGRPDEDVSASGLRRLSGSEPLSPMTGLRTAIVGSGFVARVHAAAVRDLGGRVVAVCSRTRAGAEALAAEIGGSVSAYDSLAELLGEGGVDVVHVCTPNVHHAEQTLLALEHGANVVCEKPLATSVEESA